jgi:hypothetical protein
MPNIHAFRIAYNLKAKGTKEVRLIEKEHSEAKNPEAHKSRAIYLF